MATKREQITNFLNKNGYASTFKGDQFEQVVNAIELYTNVKENRKKTPTVSVEVLANFKVAAEIFNNIFPAIKSPSTQRYARDPEKEVMEALLWFVENYSFDMDTIMSAADKYIREREVDNWSFLQSSKYFIRKQQKDKTWTSNLANFCQQISDGVDKYENQLPNLRSKVV